MRDLSEKKRSLTLKNIPIAEAYLSLKRIMTSFLPAQSSFTVIPIPEVDRGRYGIGSRFKWIRYPLFEYYLLKHVYTLSYYDYTLKDKRLREAADILMLKQDSRGRWTIDKPYRGWGEVEFRKKGSPSKWVTLNTLRVLKRLYN